jgi:cellulose synthase (UDP-forming)
MIKRIDHNRKAHATGVVLILAALWFVPWLFAHADLSLPWLSIPFMAATLVVAAAAILSVVNRWQRAVPERAPVPPGQEPTVAVIIPTMGEPLNLLEGTVRSVLAQDWPHERMWLLVSDDGHSDAVEGLVSRLAEDYPRATVGYHRPPPKGDPLRHGEAKAGNLNSALKLLPDHVEYIETRDADDLVGDRHFLRETVGQMLVAERLAFVQTCKAGQVSRHDPFDNQQPHFFQCAMLSRYAANAVFPCGSGVVWRRAALHEIGDFPTWNLVEDLQSGLEALRLGWDGCYLPILGAYAQHSPEDLPNFTKQRGTWALDTMRLTLWAPKGGLRLRQRLQFYELGIFYMQGPATLVFLLAPVLGFIFHWYPVVTSTSAFILHFWPFAAALELHLIAVHRPLSFEQIWRARLVWAGLCFVYARACFLAVIGGPHGKPRYVVTRKENNYAWHWRLIAPHVLVLVLLVGSMAWSIGRHSVLTSFDIGSAYWAGLYSLLLLGFVGLSWHGVASRLGSRVRLTPPGPALAAGAHGSELAARSLAAEPAATRSALWSAASSPGAVRTLPVEARGTRSREALRQLELRIGEWARHSEVPLAPQLSAEPTGSVPSAAVES